jgi:hypothetical protein
MTADDLKIVETMTLLSTLMVAQGYSNDPRKWREVVASLQTGCIPSTAKSGADCINERLIPTQMGCERKSTIGKHPCGNYTGISRKNSWEEQVEYLKVKIRDLGRHYFDRFDPVTGELIESWWMTGEQAYEILLPKIKKDFLRKKKQAEEGKSPADPRPSGTICWKEIKKYGTKEI